MIQDQHGYTLEKLLSHADLNGKIVLEIGCGSGRITQLYANSAQFVVGIEPEMADVSEAARTIPNASFLCGSGMNMPFPSESFDIILFTLSLHHHPHCLDALSEARRIVSSSGQVLVLEPTPESQIQRFCNIFVNEDHRLAAVEKALPRCDLEITSRECFTTYWEFSDFEDAANYAFTYYNHPPDKQKRQALENFLGTQAHDAPLTMTDTLRLTCLRRF